MADSLQPTAYRKRRRAELVCSGRGNAVLRAAGREGGASPAPTGDARKEHRQRPVLKNVEQGGSGERDYTEGTEVTEDAEKSTG